jgi:hypothetical protein
MSSLPQPPVPPNSVQLYSSLLPTFSFSAGNPIFSYTINLQLSTERHSFFNRRLHVAFDSNPIYQPMSTKTLQRISCHANFPLLQPHPKVYVQLYELLTQHIGTEQELMGMLNFAQCSPYKLNFFATPLRHPDNDPAVATDDISAINSFISQSIVCANLFL